MEVSEYKEEKGVLENILYSDISSHSNALSRYTRICFGVSERKEEKGVFEDFPTLSRYKNVPK